MWDSIYRLPNDFSNFWDAHFINKAQILFLLFLLYLFGYYSSKLLVNRNILKWGIFIFFFLPFLISIFHSKQIIFILPVTLGILKGLFLGNTGFNPLAGFEGITDFILSIRHRRQQETINPKHENTEKYANQQSHSSGNSTNFNKDQFREEMRQQREQKEQEAKQKEQQSDNSDKDTHSYEDEMRWRNGYRAKPEEGVSEPPPKTDRTRQDKTGNFSKKQNSHSKEKQANTSSTKQKPKELNPNILADAYEILGVEYGASMEECKKTRMTLLVMYHPDKVSHLNETRRKIAEEEAKRINAAWERIRSI